MEGIRGSGSLPGTSRATAAAILSLALALSCGTAVAQTFATPGQNSNIVGITPNLANVPDFQRKQQQEPNCIIRPGNRAAKLCAFNDMRAADLELVQGDSWMGLAMTIDDAETWFSRLAPGFKGDGSRSINKGFAADPSLIAIPGNSPGLAGLTYIAADRPTGGATRPTNSVLAFQRLVEFPREDQDFWKAEDFVRIVATSVEDDGFIDKSMSYYKVDRPDEQGSITQMIDVEGESSNIEITTATGTILIVYTVFPEGRTGSRLLARRSFDNGVTWTAATVLADSLTDVTGASITELGDNFVIAYRRAGGTIPGDEDNCQVNQDDNCTTIDVSDAIMSVMCTNDATMSCTDGTEIMQVCPFDQPASGSTFRSFTFPWLAYDGTRVWAVAADRRYAGDASCTPVAGAPGVYTGKPRIVAKSTTDGTEWVGSRSNSAEPIVIAPRATGFQVMPVSAGAKGEIYVAWTDTTVEEEQGLPAGNNALLINDYTGSVGGATARVFRKADVWMTRLDGSSCSTRRNRGCTPSIENPVRVSSYLTAFEKTNPDVKQEIEADLKNLRTHSSGSLAFWGDYKAMAVLPLRQIADDSWIPNAVPEGTFGPERPGFTDREDVFLAWGDNRDVDANFVIDPEGSQQLLYTPPLNSDANPGGPVVSVEDLDPDQIKRPPALLPDEMLADGVADDDPVLPSETFTCVPGSLDFSGSRDVNVYGVNVLETPSLLAPTPFKPLGSIQRMYPLEFTNIDSDAPLDICLQVANQPGDYPLNGLASFYQLPAIGPFDAGDQVELLEAQVPAASSISRSVFVSTGIEDTVITISAYEGACPALPGGTFGPFINSVEVGNGPLENSAYCEESGTCIDVSLDETHDITLAGPVLEAPVLEAPSYEATTTAAPVLEAPSFEAPSYEAPSLEAPVYEAPSYEAPVYEAPVLEAPVLEAPVLEAPSLEAGTPIGDAPPEEIVYQDITYVVRAAGSVTTTFSADASIAGLDFGQIAVQLIAWTNNAYTTTSQCLAVPTSNQQIISFTQLDADSLASVTLPETVSKTLQNPYAGALSFTAFPDKDIGITFRIHATGDAAATLYALEAEREECRLDPACDENSGEYGTQRLISFGASAHQCSFTDAVINTNPPPGTEIEDCLNNGNEKIRPDFQPPLIVATPGDQTVEAATAAGATAVFSVTATDNTDPDPTVTCDAESGVTVFGLGANTVTCFAEDFKGNSSVASFTITVEDTSAPVFRTTPLPDVTASATGPAGGIATWGSILADDIVDGEITAVCESATGLTSGDAFPLGSTTVTCTATDTRGNDIAQSFDVIVTDNEPPTFDAPDSIPDVTAEANERDSSGVVGAIVSYTLPTASDNVDTSPSVTCTPASGSFFPLGLPTPVSCTASDTATPPNSVTLNPAFSVIVQDTTAPVLTLPTTVNVEPREAGDPLAGPVSIDPATNTFTVEANLPPDEGDGAQVTFVATAADFVEGPTGVTCTPSSGTVFTVGTTTEVECSTVDSGGYGTSGSFFIAVQDLTDPTFVLSDTTFTIVADSLGGATVDLVGSGDVVATDRGVPIDTTCYALPDPNEPPVERIELPALLPPGSYDVTCEADGDTVTTVSVDVTVAIEDNIAPELFIPAGTAEVDADSDGTATVNLLGTIFDTDGDGTPDAAITATDNVDADPTISCERTGGTGSYDLASPDVFGTGTHDISCTATDDPDSSGSANTSAAGTFTLVVNDPFPYGINLIVPDKGAKAGATLPIDWVYTVSPDSDVPIDSGFITPAVRWFGPFARQDTECADTASLIEIGDDAGSSDKRYSASNQQWQFSWKTLDAWKGTNILLVIEPPGADFADATRCVNFK